jgi:hypothetical protein
LLKMTVFSRGTGFQAVLEAEARRGPIAVEPVFLSAPEVGEHVTIKTCLFNSVNSFCNRLGRAWSLHSASFWSALASLIAMSSLLAEATDALEMAGGGEGPFVSDEPT